MQSLGIVLVHLVGWMLVHGARPGALKASKQSPGIVLCCRFPNSPFPAAQTGLVGLVGAEDEEQETRQTSL